MARTKNLLLAGLVTLMAACSRPIARFSYSGDLSAPSTVQFRNESKNADKYEWSFGNTADTSSIESPAHKFNRSGWYEIRLKAYKSKKFMEKTERIHIAAPEKCLVELQTPMGNMIIELYDATPQHRDNFLKLAEEGFYNGLLFHRVINGFMIQGGDPDSKGAPAGKRLGSGGPGYQVPAEFSDTLLHVKGALAAARTGDQVNPEKKSSGSQFYIVQGKPLTKDELDRLSASRNFSYSPDQLEKYMSVGGTPFLDQSYTVFGKVIEGLDVIDAIAAAPTDAGDRPISDVTMKLIVIK